MNLIKYFQLQTKDEMLVNKENTISYYGFRIALAILVIFIIGTQNLPNSELYKTRFDFAIVITGVYMFALLLFKRVSILLTLLMLILIIPISMLISAVYFNQVYPTLSNHYTADVITSLSAIVITTILTVLFYKLVFKYKFIWKK